jgi:hypothetical protein
MSRFVALLRRYFEDYALDGSIVLIDSQSIPGKVIVTEIVGVEVVGGVWVFDRRPLLRDLHDAIRSADECPGPPCGMDAAAILNEMDLLGQPYVQFGDSHSLLPLTEAG